MPPDAPASPASAQRMGFAEIFALVMLIVAAGRWVTRPDSQADLVWRSTETVIDLNRADAATLQLLPGVGAGLAQRIVEDRRTTGPFESVADLTRVSGIGDRTVARLTPYVTAGPIAR